ncbi:arylsulfatase B [Siphonobacter aquaeclarae]|uniref:Arylsulfatase B n=1 Tax=Siphonobacter aquaeclarae TaxID=563176 RepID=A0A1G9HG48_9BACT|nr:arylsulfatase [Siphonobacter aquaeclarae]SDL11885.1 arylsulfatase B [Siphonobacter aquaeclarae]
MRKRVLFCSLLALFSAAHAQKKPNIILIVADDLGWNDVGYHNPAIVSPNLNALAEKGTELRRFYVASICSPTRSGLLTGKYPDRFGIRNEVIRPNRIGGLPLSEQTLANVLDKAGYTRRGAFGKWHLGHSDKRYHPLQRGFTSFYGHYNGAIDYFTHFRNGALDWHRGYEASRDTGYSVALVGNEAAKFIRESAGSPFFAYVAFNGVHAPNQARKQDLLRNGYDPAGTRLEGKSGEGAEYNTADYGQRGRGNTLRQTFSAQVTGLDDAIGTILRAVEDKGIADNTLIWFLSDNGGTPTFGGNNDPLRGVKNTEWEGGVRSTSLIYWKGKIGGGKKVDEVIAFIDVLPTLAAWTGAQIPAGLDGIDARSAIQGKALPDRILFLGREAAVSKRWKLNQGQFFDLQADPSEKKNVAEEYPSEYKTFTEALTSFKKFVQPFSLAAQPAGWRPPENWTIAEP